MPIKMLLKGFFCVAMLIPISRPPALASPYAKHSVTWDFTFSGKDASASPTIDDVLSSAQAAQQPVMIDFSAEWCASCRLLDRNVYTAPDVILEASRFVRIRIDVTSLDDATEQLTRRFAVVGLPTVAFVSSRGKVLSSSQIVGLADASTLARKLREIP